jgi:hypothetical protein
VNETHFRHGLDIQAPAKSRKTNLKDRICILFFCHSHSHSALCNVYPVALDRHHYDCDYDCDCDKKIRYNAPPKVNNEWSLIISRLLSYLLGSSNDSTVGMLVWPPRLWAGTAALKIESYLDVH